MLSYWWVQMAIDEIMTHSERALVSVGRVAIDLGCGDAGGKRWHRWDAATAGSGTSLVVLVVLIFIHSISMAAIGTFVVVFLFHELCSKL